MEDIIAQVLGWLFSEAGIAGVLLAFFAGREWWERRQDRKRWDKEVERLTARAREGWDAFNALVKETNEANLATIAVQKDMTNAINLLTASVKSR